MSQRVYPSDRLLHVSVSPQVFADIEKLVRTGLFGFNIENCAQRFIDEAVRQKTVEGWLPMPAPLTAKRGRK